MAKKTPKSKRGTQRDINGRPTNRASTWDAKKGKCPKKDRRKIKKELNEHSR